MFIWKVANLLGHTDEGNSHLPQVYCDQGTL